MAETLLAVDDTIATVTLAGPLDRASVDRLRRSCEQVGVNDAVRVLVLQAAAETWTGWSVEAWERADEAGLMGDPFGPLAALPQPTIVVVEGAVRDAGLELALCGDIRVAAASATFALPGIAQGALPIAAGLQRLGRLVGRARALELLLADAPIDAPTALQWGLASVVAAPAPNAARAEARALAGRIAERAPIATRMAKESLRRGLEMPLAEALRFETDLTVLLQATADRAEGVRAFGEKRPPRFLGR